MKRLKDTFRLKGIFCCPKSEQPKRKRPAANRYTTARKKCRFRHIVSPTTAHANNLSLSPYQLSNLFFMVIHHNMLRFYRKQSRLTQLDIAFILGLENNSNISRWEKGERAPALQTLLVYQLLFDIPIESLFERQKHEVIPMLQERLTRRIQDLKGNENESDATERIGCLESILIRLNHIATL